MTTAGSVRSLLQLVAVGLSRAQFWAPAKIEIRAGVEAQIGVGEDPELEYGHRHRLQGALHPDFGVCGGACGYGRRVGGDQAYQPLIRAG
jgi:hypothetical protein